VGYKTSSGIVSEFPADLRLLAAAEPQYETLPGWQAPTRGATDFAQLPAEAQRYIRRLEDVSGVECAIISTGSDRNETIVKTGGAVAKWIGGERDVVRSS
jgi:adenylosuccinate synthase